MKRRSRNGIKPAQIDEYYMIQADLNILFWLILTTFTLGAVVLAVSTLINVFRLRNVRMSWRAGKLGGYPLFATVFLGVAVLITGISFYESSTEAMVASGLYLGFSLCWFATSYFATKCFVTDYGIVKNVNEPSQTVAWHQIRDFVEKDKNSGVDYIFLYYQDEKDIPGDLVRLELMVPSKEIKSFQKLISHKLGRRIRCYTNTDINVEQFKR